MLAKWFKQGHHVYIIHFNMSSEQEQKIESQEAFLNEAEKLEDTPKEKLRELYDFNQEGGTDSIDVEEWMRICPPDGCVVVGGEKVHISEITHSMFEEEQADAGAEGVESQGEYLQERKKLISELNRSADINEVLGVVEDPDYSEVLQNHFGITPEALSDAMFELTGDAQYESARETFKETYPALYEALSHLVPQEQQIEESTEDGMSKENEVSTEPVGGSDSDESFSDMFRIDQDQEIKDKVPEGEAETASPVAGGLEERPNPEVMGDEEIIDELRVLAKLTKDNPGVRVDSAAGVEFARPHLFVGAEQIDRYQEIDPSFRKKLYGLLESLRDDAATLE